MRVQHNDVLSRLRARYGVPVEIDEDCHKWEVDYDNCGRPIRLRFQTAAWEEFVHHFDPPRPVLASFPK